MISYFVRYRGTTADPANFTARYTAQHAAILRRFPAIRSLVLHQPVDWTDPFPVNRGNTFLLAQMQFDRAADLDAALSSPARQAAREDFHLFPAFAGDVTHEAMRGKIIF
jgi:uncharacterized protein (TIGR02118 family)